MLQNTLKILIYLLVYIVLGIEYRAAHLLSALYHKAISLPPCEILKMTSFQPTDVLDLINVFKTQNSFHSQNEFLGLGHD
jgi:hypothetical protein